MVVLIQILREDGGTTDKVCVLFSFLICISVLLSPSRSSITPTRALFVDTVSLTQDVFARLSWKLVFLVYYPGCAQPAFRDFLRPQPGRPFFFFFEVITRVQEQSLWRGQPEDRCVHEYVAVNLPLVVVDPRKGQEP